MHKPVGLLCMQNMTTRKHKTDVHVIGGKSYTVFASENKF